MLVQGKSNSTAAWYSAQAPPRSTNSFVMVFFAAPVTRTVARMDMPSHKQDTICARLSVASRLTILTTVLERSRICNWLADVRCDGYCCSGANNVS